jgi:hypothetical protein
MQMAYPTSDNSRDFGDVCFRTTFLFNNLVFKRVGFRSVIARDGLRIRIEISLSLRYTVLLCATRLSL